MDDDALTLPVRTVFARACESEDTPLPDTLRSAITGELDRAGHDGDPRCDLSAAAAWADAERARFTALFAAAELEGCADVLVRRAVLACAPLASLSGAWLQWMSEPGNAEELVTMRALALFAADVGAGHPGASRGDAYLALMRHVRVAVHARPAARLVHDRRIADPSFHLPALALTMSRRPDTYQGEIIGLDLFSRAVGLLPPLAGVRTRLPHAADWAALDPGRAPAVDDAQAVAAAFTAAAGTAGTTATERGFAWAFAALRRWSDEVYRELDAARDPSFEMAELIRSRAREASAYHDRFVMRGRPLKQWLAEARTDPAPFLAALADSRLVQPGRSGASRLTGELVSENGRMFRVFPDDDLDVINRWIDALPADPAERARLRPAAQEPRSITFRPAPDTAGDGAAPAGLREAYTRLLRRTITPATRRYALRYVEGWLARSRHGMKQAAQSLPAEPPSDGLRPWLLDRHDLHNSEFQDGSDDPLPERAALIDSTLQLAPLTLIDGAWLAGHTDYQLASAERGHFLFETYWDELGNGRPELNHPLIYRAVLREMGIELPPTRSPEFAAWPALRDRSFELPVYWLAIGRFPLTFEPEILGLNLAMELSGVGGSYRRARQALKRYGFSTAFVDVHNTIDNVATGHSAWAADAVDGYLAQQAPAARTDAWDRIRAGYRSLNPPSGFWARNAARRARVEASAHV
ncbi:iron-containing redox enzyme family protein [Streptomyces sp. H10-C2]|uniref:iron-containing redox enzyme family protein n=1 Tax=unclassified Streptomyces TaxID=2593676 RepID=UPI0024BAC798|nr:MULTISPECIES: iron-containing redox enzyme family protein [unclassified Streptomyces]MDJ0344795.1 iron-containing redox enzyme family protein [Streptomyces sp. PH10-H1]MDJ0369680.1 iron-containing redox enzyme family protein [Streptomyces sp. H10-C2]